MGIVRIILISEPNRGKYEYRVPTHPFDSILIFKSMWSV